MKWVYPLLLMLLMFPSLLASAENGHQKLNQGSAVVLNINHASADDFVTLPGIGPKLAAQIVAYREKHGPFLRVEDLLVHRGIGPKKWKMILPHLRVAPEPKASRERKTDSRD